MSTRFRTQHARGALLAAVLSLLLLVASACAARSEVAPPQTDDHSDEARHVLGEGEVMRGITVSTHRGGREWGDPAVVRPTLAKIRAVGATWVAFHPYARIHGDGTVAQPSWPGDAFERHLQVPLAEASALGLKVMVKPHLAYWGSPFSWRGEIRFDTEQEWRRFFDSYERWIVEVARASTSAGVFVVGTELDATVHRPEWLRVIAAVRAVHPAPLTFASNWPDFERLPFWRELDAVGIQAYFPVSREEQPTSGQIAAFWRQRMGSLAAFSRRVERPVIFTELGYNRSSSSATQPWLAGVDEPQAEELQQRLLHGALGAIEHEPSVLGAFLWKWFPEPVPLGRDFQAASPAVQRVLRQVWRSEESAAPLDIATPP